MKFYLGDLWIKSIVLGINFYNYFRKTKVLTLFELSLNHWDKNYPCLLCIHHSVVIMNSLEQRHSGPSINSTNGETIKWYENLVHSVPVNGWNKKNLERIFSTKKISTNQFQISLKLLEKKINENCENFFYKFFHPVMISSNWNGRFLLHPA